MSRLLRLAIGVALAGSVAAACAAEAGPDTENGRYALSPTAEGMLRLDTRSGAVSVCKNGEQGWACFTVPDERSAFDAEIGRLQAENDRLRARLAESETAQNKIGEALPKSDPLVPSLPKSADAERKIEIPLPSDREMDRVMGFLESAWKRLVEMAARIQRDTSGKI